jgi:hypothetical protein
LRRRIGSAGIGAAAGGFIGALTGMNIPEDDAGYYAEAVRKGGAVVLVKADEATANMALDILNRSGAQDARERREGHRRVADQRDADQRTEDFERDYRSDFDQRFKGGGYTYEHFSPAYRYGYELAHDEALRGKEWSAVEAEARRDWDERNPNTWEQVADGLESVALDPGERTRLRGH